MMIMKPLIVAMMVIVLGSSTTAWNFTIVRNSTNIIGALVVDSIDQFSISECIDSDNLCTKFGGQRLQDKCQCVCNQNKSTFGFYNNEWKCTENSIVRQHAASATCRYRLQRPSNRKGDDDPLFTLPVLGPAGDNTYVRYIPVNKTCTIVAANATFLKCDGTLGKLTESKVNNKLAFQTKLPGTVYVGPYKEGSSVDPSLDGRVIRIPIECEDLTWNSSQCVTFKIKGQLTCTYLSGSTGDDVPAVIIAKEPTRSTLTPTTIVTGKIKKSEGDDTTPAVAVIAGSVAGGVVFVILIVVIIILVIHWKRRKPKAKKKSVRTEENLAYEQGPDFSMTLSRPKSIRPLPEPPSQWPYASMQRDPSLSIQHSNGTNSGPRDHEDYSHCNGEPLYGEIDDNTYSRLSHQPLQPTRSKNDKVMFANGPSVGPSTEIPNKSGTLISSDGSGLYGFEEYDVVGGEINSSLSRGKPKSFRSLDGTNSLGPEARSPYDVPESVIRNSSKERPQNNNPGNATGPSNDTYQPLQRDTLNRENYESVWEDIDDDLVTRIDLS